jgi:hypothetical protein
MDYGVPAKDARDAIPKKYQQIFNNVLNQVQELLDFDDCGFGYWLFDLGVVLAHYFSNFNNPG